MGLRTTQKKGVKSTGWIRDTVLRIYTEDQVREDWNAIAPVDRIKVMASWVPKEMVSDNNGLQINLILRGVEPKNVITAHVVGPIALTDGDNDDL
jgi:hypothetical protein